MSDQLRFEVYAYDQIVWPQGPQGPAVVSSWRKDDDQPAQRHSRTSRAAAKEIKPYVPSIRQRVHEVIIKEGPISDQAIAIKLGLAENTVRPRRVELVAHGWARAAPDTVLTKSKRQATAWIAAEP